VLLFIVCATRCLAARSCSAEKKARQTRRRACDGSRAPSQHYIETAAASLLARSLGNNALPNLTRLYISYCGTDDDGIIALISALEQNIPLLHLDLRDNYNASERVVLALAESLPGIKVLQRLDLSWRRVATFPDVIFEVLRSKPNLIPSEDTGGKEAAKDTGVTKKRKCGDE
jgi:hypothetical protein